MTASQMSHSAKGGVSKLATIVKDAVKKVEVKLLGWSDEEAEQASGQADDGEEEG